ncbi:MAG: NUDIX hydrolase [Gemmatales bacterium]|nr:NUDIX hydrolase [Gemmatales bacterium]MCS7160846.1 NUDIX hydrolase [Gemmatales bacterium]MDW8176048.1 NUDIX hydrolase [Gemmatales bacterium]MDW8222494.1 NUDIX hydrolase [Gemmatales bacterium]
MPRQLVFHGRKIELVLDTVTMPDGQQLVREIVLHRGAAVMLPVLPDGRIVLVWNYRYPIAQRLLELPAGTLDPNETPESCAARELEEEIGYRAGRLTKLAEFYPSPGVLSECMHLFLAEDLQPTQQKLDPGEDIETEFMPVEEAIAKVLRGEIRDGKTMVGLLLYDRLRRS